MYAYAHVYTPIPLPTRLTRYVLPLTPLGKKRGVLKRQQIGLSKKNSRKKILYFSELTLIFFKSHLYLYIEVASVMTQIII